jgi:hypothetical protein
MCDFNTQQDIHCEDNLLTVGEWVSVEEISLYREGIFESYMAHEGINLLLQVLV